MNKKALFLKSIYILHTLYFIFLNYKQVQYSILVLNTLINLFLAWIQTSHSNYTKHAQLLFILNKRKKKYGIEIPKTYEMPFNVMKSLIKKNRRYLFNIIFMILIWLQSVLIINNNFGIKKYILISNVEYWKHYYALTNFRITVITIALIFSIFTIRTPKIKSKIKIQKMYILKIDQLFKNEHKNYEYSYISSFSILDKAFYKELELLEEFHIRQQFIDKIVLFEQETKQLGYNEKLKLFKSEMNSFFKSNYILFRIK